MEEQPAVNTQVQQAPINPVPISKKPNQWIIAAIILAVVVFIGSIYVLSLPSRKPVSPPPKPLVSPSPISTTPDPTTNWKTYTVKTSQLQFRLPPKFTELGELKENVEVVPSPFTGRRLCVTFPEKTSFAGRNCEMNYFLIIAISSDYNVGRGAGFGDLQGFTYRDGSYYARLLGKEFEIPSNLVQRINNKNGVEIIKIRREGTYPPSEEEPLPIYYAYAGENNIGALVNTSDKTFPGFAVLFELKGGFTEGDFDQILSTFKFLDREENNQQLGDAATKEECLAKGGVWQKWGLAQLEYCQIPAKDAEKSCTDKSQCTYGCISYTGTVPGKCSIYKSTFGCFSVVRNGKAEALCSD